MANQRVYPVSVEGELSEELRRWLWFVKGILLIPHVMLLFRGRCPQYVYGLVMGFNRWSLRVPAYVALMRDEYSPLGLSP